MTEITKRTVAEVFPRRFRKVRPDRYVNAVMPSRKKSALLPADQTKSRLKNSSTRGRPLRPANRYTIKASGRNRKRKVIEVKNGEYTVKTGTVTEKYGTFTGRYIVFYFRVRDERGVEEEYQITHRPSYRKAEVGSRCMVFKYDSLKNNPNKYPNRPGTLGMDVVLM